MLHLIGTLEALTDEVAVLEAGQLTLYLFSLRVRVVPVALPGQRVAVTSP